MKSRAIDLLIILVCFVCAIAASETALADSQKSRTACSHCHSKLNSMLPEKHPAVAGEKIEACFKCHEPRLSDTAEPRPFSAKMHLKHVQPSVKLNCTGCHLWKPDGNLGLPGKHTLFGKQTAADIELNREVFISWATSSNIDALHAKKQIICSGCHGKSLPQKGDTVENERCIACHGNYEALANKTRPAQFPDRNPHQSHLGEIGCAVCHKAHKPSAVYCLNCHRKFYMKIAGATEQ